MLAALTEARSQRDYWQSRVDELEEEARGEDDEPIAVALNARVGGHVRPEGDRWKATCADCDQSLTVPCRSDAEQQLYWHRQSYHLVKS